MESQYANIQETELLCLINRRYGIRGEHIWLHRESGGRVYYICCPEGRKVFKLYRPMHAQSAIQSTGILSYLDGCGFPVVKIIPAADGGMYICLDTPHGACIGILFEFARVRCIGFLHRWRENKQPLILPRAEIVGRQVGLMHRLMEGYDGPIIRKGRDRYIDDLILLMRRNGHDEGKIRDLEEYGNELWTAVNKLPGGFCHGDMHTGNTVLRGGQFTWMDFDRAAYSHPVIDVGWLTDGSDFNVFDDGALDRSLQLFDALYRGYAMERPLTDGEVAAVFGCTAIIHYDLIASITIQKGGILGSAIVDEQHDWLMRWRALCGRILGRG